MSQADDFHAFGTRVRPESCPKKNWSLKVEPAKMAPKRPVMYTPGPVDVKAYEAGHAEPPKKEVPDAPK